MFLKQMPQRHNLTNEFTINITTVDMVTVTDHCGIVSGNEEYKSKLFEVFYGEIKPASLIPACPLNIECRRVPTVDLPTNTLIIGEIVNIYREEKYLQRQAGNEEGTALPPDHYLQPCATWNR
ncbi:MAG: flavin reductase [Thermodesulfovibrionales bacterium]